MTVAFVLRFGVYIQNISNNTEIINSKEEHMANKYHNRQCNFNHCSGQNIFFRFVELNYLSLMLQFLT